MASATLYVSFEDLQNPAGTPTNDWTPGSALPGEAPVRQAASPQRADLLAWIPSIGEHVTQKVSDITNTLDE